MGIETYSGIMNVKYSLQMKTSSELYKRSDPLHDPVDKNLCYFIHTSNAKFKKRAAEKKQICEKEDLSKGIKVYSKKLFMFYLNSIFLFSLLLKD